jgi:hypothetical protein
VIGGNHGKQITASTSLAEDCPSRFSYTATPGADNPRWMAIFINNFFNLFWFDTVPGNVLKVIVSHSGSNSQTCTDSS